MIMNTSGVIDTQSADDHGEVGGGLLRLRIDLGYDGTDFSGWATQPGRRTVQGVLESGLGTVLRIEPPRLTVAGRTDAGVHARGQVCHVDVPEAAWLAAPGRSDRPAGQAVVRRLAGVLPVDVRVSAVEPARPGFDARFSAAWRRYAYRVADTPFGVDPLLRRFVHWHHRPLDVARLNAAADGLLGEHDFAAYCRARAGATTIRTLQALGWERDERGLAAATVQADAFCHNQVRALVGALLAVGDGRRPVGWPAEVLAAGVRDSAVIVAPPHGLILEAVGYPPEDQLAARAAESRRARTAPPSSPTSR
jgi:tRNA pseudouridine38-40 synthase